MGSEPGRLVGRRVVVRRVTGSRYGRPGYSDLIGHLVAAEADALVVRRADGTAVRVPLAEVHRLRAVPPPPARVGPADVLTLEEVAAAGWPAPDTGRLGGWLLRAAEGFTGRANSVLPLGEPGLPLPDALAAVESWYAARGLPARFQVPLPAQAELDAALHERGYTADRVPTYVLTADLADALTAVDADRPGRTGRPDPPGSVRLDSTPSPEWLAGYHYRGGRAGLPEVATRIMTGHPRVVFGSWLSGGRALAVVRAVVDHAADHTADRAVDQTADRTADQSGQPGTWWAGLTALEVDEAHRRRGLAGRMVSAALGWAGGLGATRVYLQVFGANTGALAFYDRLGFTRHHRYHYRVLATG